MDALGENSRARRRVQRQDGLEPWGQTRKAIWVDEDDHRDPDLLFRKEGIDDIRFERC